MKTCTFTGHRPNKLPWLYNEEDRECLKFKQVLAQEILATIEDGYDYFICGGAQGMDTWSAELVLYLRDSFKHIKLEIAVPCQGQESLWPRKTQERYYSILKEADKVTMCSTEHYRPQLMFLRDMYMVNKAEKLIALYEGSSGGTAHTIGLASKKGLHIIKFNSMGLKH